jgi:hypothetical protein
VLGIVEARMDDSRQSTAITLGSGYTQSQGALVYGVCFSCMLSCFFVCLFVFFSLPYVVCRCSFSLNQILNARPVRPDMLKEANARGSLDLVGSLIIINPQKRNSFIVTDKKGQCMLAYCIE